jgi:hypothetical protein
MSSPYVFPLGKGATTGRVDQGNDFGGTGPIKAIGRGRILKVGEETWGGHGQGGTGILYELLEGPAAGKNVYINEGIKLASGLKKGQIVNPGQVLGELIPGSSTGIEMGWASASGSPISAGEYTEGKETKGGKNFRGFLDSIAGKKPEPGILEEAGEWFGIISNPASAPAAATKKVAKAAANVPTEVAEGLSKMFTEHAESFALNLVLLVGGAFMIYYGAALMLGVRTPGKDLVHGAEHVANAAKKVGQVAGAAAA